MRTPAWIVALPIVLTFGTSLAKPRPPLKPTPATPAPTSAGATDASPTVAWLRQILAQDGSAAAIPVPFADLIMAVTGKRIEPFNVFDATDASVSARLSAMIDGLLPVLNRPDGLVRQAKRPGVVPFLVEDAFQTALGSVAGLTCEPLVDNDPASLLTGRPEGYPAFRLTDKESHRVYYVGFGFFATGERDAAQPLFTADPRQLARGITADGRCLLIVLERNHKTGPDVSFLNWELVDLAASKVRLNTSFDGTRAEALTPRATINDGRRGRD